MADAILGKPPKPAAPAPLRKRITDLKAAPRENDAAWWNDLAGAHLRLGEAAEAVKLLEGVTNRFANDYGVHANLGTAYHLLGRYADAEREIARDLEINPDAHFGLEKFHLALLQHLARNKDYQRRHVYVDEFSQAFFRSWRPYFSGVPKGVISSHELQGTNGIPMSELVGELTQLEAREKTNSTDRRYLLAEIASWDTAPAYRLKWNLAFDTNLQAGLIYMAKLNPGEPACFVMLGVKSLLNHDLNLAAEAFNRAITLGSPQAEELRDRIAAIDDHIREARKSYYLLGGLVFLALLAVAYYLFDLYRRRRTRIQT